MECLQDTVMSAAVHQVQLTSYLFYDIVKLAVKGTSFNLSPQSNVQTSNLPMRQPVH